MLLSADEVVFPGMVAGVNLGLADDLLHDALDDGVDGGPALQGVLHGAFLLIVSDLVAEDVHEAVLVRCADDNVSETCMLGEICVVRNSARNTDQEYVFYVTECAWKILTICEIYSLYIYV